MNSLKQDDDPTLTIKELLAIHNSLSNHNESCEKACLLEILQSLEEGRVKNQLPHPPSSQGPIRVEEGEIITFSDKLDSYS